MPRGYEVARMLVKDEKRVLAKLPKGSRLVALDERGVDCTTTRFATFLDEETTFVIGGPDGLTDEVRGRAASLLRLSSMTLPHALAQVVLCEQLYRAASLRTGHPYHRD